MKGSRIWLIILIVAVVLALAFLFFRLAPSSRVETAPVILPTPRVTDNGQTPSSSGDDGSGVIVTPDTVQAVIERLGRADSYSRTVTADTFWIGGSARQEIAVWVRGDSTKLIISSGGALKNVLIEADRLWIWYSGSDAVYEGVAGDDAADEYQTLLTYEQVLELDKSSISDAGYTDYNDESCIYVRYASGLLGYESVCYVSVETGLLMGCETFDGDELIYSMTSTIPDISTPDDSVFTRP